MDGDSRYVYDMIFFMYVGDTYDVICLSISISTFPPNSFCNIVHLNQPKASLESRTGELLNAYLMNMIYIGIFFSYISCV